MKKVVIVAATILGLGLIGVAVVRGGGDTKVGSVQGNSLEAQSRSGVAKGDGQGLASSSPGLSALTASSLYHKLAAVAVNVVPGLATGPIAAVVTTATGGEGARRVAGGGRVGAHGDSGVNLFATMNRRQSITPSSAATGDGARNRSATVRSSSGSAVAKVAQDEAEPQPVGQNPGCERQSNRCLAPKPSSSGAPDGATGSRPSKPKVSVPKPSSSPEPPSIDIQ